MPIVDDILSALKSEERVMLATIVEARGSTPAAASSKMLLTRGGSTAVGTVGGGCMEGEIVQRAAAPLYFEHVKP